MNDFFEQDDLKMNHAERIVGTDADYPADNGGIMHREQALKLFNDSFLCWCEVKLGLWCTKLSENCYATIDARSYSPQGCRASVRSSGTLEILAEEFINCDEAIALVERWADQHDISEQYTKSAAWRSRPASERQRELLARRHEPLPDHLTAGEASMWIGKQELKRNADEAPTENQLCYLYITLGKTPPAMNKREASELIGKLKEATDGATHSPTR